MKPEAAKRLRILASSLSVLLLLALLAVGWFYWRLRLSLPQLDGTAKITGLAAGVKVDRDALGVPTIRAQSRSDAARALGWLHAQERFFQMDLMRRSAAGELAEVFGKVALTRDRQVRRHGFRVLAQKALAQLPPVHRALLDAYTEGANAGLAALGERPFEYLVLRERPQPWKPEDTLLIGYAITLDMQDEDGRYESTMMTLRDQFDLEGVAFFNPLITTDDAAFDGTTAPLPKIPSPRLVDIRNQKVSTLPHTIQTDGLAGVFSTERDPDHVIGSNAFALGGSHTANGAGLVANDMHLNLGVPNTWYRAAFEWPASAGGETRRMSGVTMPGTPVIIAGSNGRVAWGLTNSNTDTSDLIVVETQPGTPLWYNAPGHPDGAKMDVRKETIRVKGEDDLVIDYPWTQWGPIVGKNDREQPLALRWTVHEPSAANLELIGMEDVTTTAEAIKVAHRAGIPVMNIIIADQAGAVAWTLAGKLPKRVGYDGRLPVTWAFGDRRWDGFLASEEIPVITNETDGRLWSANHRHIGGEGLKRIGDAHYSRPARATLIRDGLKSLERAAPKDLLAIQLDNRATFLEPWHKLLMQTLTPSVTGEKKARAALRGFAEKWEGQASTEAVSYRLVRDFRIAVQTRMFSAIFQRCTEANPDFRWNILSLEPATWALLRDKPAHLLNPAFKTWEELLVAAVDDVIAQIDKQGRTLPQANWGWRNTARIRHPFSHTLPSWASNWLNMPADPLPGGDDMPRMQTPVHGASERFVVSPGREAEGIFHMPGGQSGHPLSSYYRAGHSAWVRGEATPFLPGKTEHTLTLSP